MLSIKLILTFIFLQIGIPQNKRDGSNYKKRGRIEVV
jgi:hypothetical protein